MRPQCLPNPSSNPPGPSQPHFSSFRVLEGDPNACPTPPQTHPALLGPTQTVLGTLMGPQGLPNPTWPYSAPLNPLEF